MAGHHLLADVSHCINTSHISQRGITTCSPLLMLAVPVKSLSLLKEPRRFGLNTGHRCQRNRRDQSILRYRAKNLLFSHVGTFWPFKCEKIDSPSGHCNGKRSSRSRDSTGNFAAFIAIFLGINHVSKKRNIFPSISVIVRKCNTVELYFRNDFKKLHVVFEIVGEMF